MSVCYYYNEDPKPAGSFRTLEECRTWHRLNRLSPWDESKIIKVETDDDAILKSIEAMKNKNPSDNGRT